MIIRKLHSTQMLNPEGSWACFQNFTKRFFIMFDG